MNMNYSSIVHGSDDGNTLETTSLLSFVHSAVLKKSQNVTQCFKNRSKFLQVFIFCIYGILDDGQSPASK